MRLYLSSYREYALYQLTVNNVLIRFHQKVLGLLKHTTEKWEDHPQIVKKYVQ